jgi:hypothetical protein
LHLLEPKIPPLIVGVVVAGAMWAAASLPPRYPTPEPVRGLVAGLLVGLGFGTMAGGVLAFRRARTTVDPLRPETSTALVTSGI